MPALRPWFVLTLLTGALAVAAGCSTMQRWTSRDESERRATRLQEIQLKVMRYADDYGGRMRDPLAELSVQSSSPERRLNVQNWRITQTTAAYTIASGPNPVVNALDIVVLATLSRMVVEQYWVRLGRRDAGAPRYSPRPRAASLVVDRRRSSTPNRPLSCTG